MMFHRLRLFLIYKALKHWKEQIQRSDCSRLFLIYKALKPSGGGTGSGAFETISDLQSSQTAFADITAATSFETISDLQSSQTRLNVRKKGNGLRLLVLEYK